MTRVPSVVSGPGGAMRRIFAVAPPTEYPSRFIRKEFTRLRRTVSPSLHRHPCQRRNSLVQASAHAPVCLAAPRDLRRVMRPTDVCFPSHSLRAPTHRAFPDRLYVPGGTAFHVAATRFGGPVSSEKGVVVPAPGLTRRTSDTPVAPIAARSRLRASLLHRRAPRSLGCRAS